MGTLPKKKIIKFMKRPRLRDRLVITPILDFDEQIKDTAVDLRLGTEFIITQKTTFPGLDPKDRDKIRKDIGNYQKLITVGLRNPLILHPNQLVLGSTLEYICVPEDLCGYVIGRSSWGRLGLIIATATFVNPGFKGCLTLELENIGEVPLFLYPGLRIAQLIFHTVDGKGEYKSRYSFPVGPEFSRVYEDKEMEFWVPRNEIK